MYAFSDTFEYGFMDSVGNFRAGEVHLEEDTDSGVWLCEIYGINGEDFRGDGSGDNWLDACRNAMDDLPFSLFEIEYDDFIAHVQFLMQEQSFYETMGI